MAGHPSIAVIGGSGLYSFLEDPPRRARVPATPDQLPGQHADLDRVGSTRAHRPATAGPCLAIVKGIVEAHRGSASVGNEQAGCRFLVQLPA